MTRASLASGLRRLARDERGVALLEFAFVLPFMVLLFLGGFQLMDAISAQRKVGSTVRTLADLTTRNTTMNATQADEILNASRQVMAPYSPNDASVRISQLKVDNNGVATVDWSRALNGTARPKAQVVTIPTELKSLTNSYFIFSEINFTYKPQMASMLIGQIPFAQTIYMSPRNSAFIVYN